jgi:hypothetical protein
MRFPLRLEAERRVQEVRCREAGRPEASHPAKPRTSGRPIGRKNLDFERHNDAILAACSPAPTARLHTVSDGLIELPVKHDVARRSFLFRTDRNACDQVRKPIRRANEAALEHDAFRLNRASCSRFLKSHRLSRKRSAHFFARCSSAARLTSVSDDRSSAKQTKLAMALKLMRRLSIPSKPALSNRIAGISFCRRPSGPWLSSPGIVPRRSPM